MGMKHQKKDRNRTTRVSADERLQKHAVLELRASWKAVRSWMVDKRPVLSFVALLTVFMLGFNVFFALWFQESAFFQSYLQLNAKVSAAILNCLGDNAWAVDNSVVSDRFSVSVKAGCDALQVSAFFVFAVIVWPMSVSIWRRMIGLVVGTLMLVLINLVRIVSLYYTGVYFPSAFEAMHVDVWQPTFVVLALLFWVMWVRWVSRAETVRSNVCA